MSADRYTQCPKCKRLNEQQSASALYGKVSEAEYQQLRKDEKRKVQLSQTSLAEYTAIEFTPAGIAEIRISAICQICGFQFDFNATVQGAVK